MEHFSLRTQPTWRWTSWCDFLDDDDILASTISRDNLMPGTTLHQRS